MSDRCQIVLVLGPNSIRQQQECNRPGARPFVAVCACECKHVMEGSGCRKCLETSTLHCLACYRSAGRHRCKVTIRYGGRRG